MHARCVCRDGKQKDPPWVLALVAPSSALLEVPEARRAATVLEDMRRLGDDKGLQPHEYPLRVDFVDAPFSQDNNMRNANEKLLWMKVEETYSEKIRAAFARDLTSEEQATLSSVGH